MSRRRFIAALAVYALWLAFLAGMIALEGRRPQERRTRNPTPIPAPSPPDAGAAPAVG